MTGLARLGRVCLALPEAHEVEAWGEPTFRVRNKPAGPAAAPWRRPASVRRAALLALVLLSACRESTGALSQELERRFARETVVRRAHDLVFRYTRDPGGRSEIREDRLASVIVTRATVLVYKNDKVGVEITPRSRRDYVVERDGPRVRIRAGQGRSEELWSFVPPDDPAGWAADIRTVIRAGPDGR